MASLHGTLVLGEVIHLVGLHLCIYGIYPLEYIRYTPVGEYLRLVILRRLSRGPAKVEEIDKLAEEAVGWLHVRYDWRVWPKLLEGEVEIRDGMVAITPRGKWILELTGEEVVRYIKKTLGVSL